MSKVTLALIVVIAAACDKKPADPPASSVARDATTVDAAAPPSAPDAAAMVEPDAAVDPLEEIAERYEACVRAADRCGWKLRTDVTYDVGFLLVTNDRVFSVLRLGGTTLGHTVEVRANGELAGAKSFDRMRGTVQSGFPRKVIRMAKGDAAEQANLAAFEKLHKKARPARAAGDYAAGVVRNELVIRRFEDGAAVEYWSFE